MNYKLKKLSEVTISIKAGGTPSRQEKDYWIDGNIPWLKISDLKDTYTNKTDEKITNAGLENSSAKIFPKGTIVYSIFATLGAISILNIDASSNQAIAGIIPDNSIIDTKYLYYCLKSEKKKIVAKKSHATQDNINLTILRNHQIIVPSLTEQKKIVAVLDRIEVLKTKKNEVDKKLKNFLNSIFYAWFFNKKQKTKKLSDLCSLISSGSTPKGGKKNYKTEGEILFIRSQNVLMNKFSEHQKLYISEKITPK